MPAFKGTLIRTNIRLNQLSLNTFCNRDLEALQPVEQNIGVVSEEKEKIIKTFLVVCVIRSQAYRRAV